MGDQERCPRDGGAGPMAPVGGPNRASMVADLGWVALAALIVLR